MILRQVVNFIFKELSAGNFFQNLGIYTLLVLLAWIVSVQFKQHSEKYKVD
jgi:hypothetical protein